MQTIELGNGTQIGYEDLVRSIQQFDNQALEKFAQEIKHVISKRKNGTFENREAELLRAIKAKIPSSAKKRQKQLYLKLQEGEITSKEYEELVLLNQMLEEKNAERLLLLGQLAKIRQVLVKTAFPLSWIV